MDVLCLRCGEGWDTDHVRHDAPQDFERKGCVITRCPACPERAAKVPPEARRRLAELAEVARCHGNDLDAFAAFLEDFGDYL